MLRFRQLTFHVKRKSRQWNNTISPIGRKSTTYFFKIYSFDSCKFDERSANIKKYSILISIVYKMNNITVFVSICIFLLMLMQIYLCWCDMLQGSNFKHRRRKQLFSRIYFIWIIILTKLYFERASFYFLKKVNNTFYSFYLLDVVNIFNNPLILNSKLLQYNLITHTAA